MNLAQLKQTAEAAVIPGEPWPDYDDIACSGFDYEADMRHIANCSPEAILKLIAVAEAAQALHQRHDKSALAVGMLHHDVYGLLEDLERALEGIE